jgi:ParB/RepB/Spo0J family partition protein
MTTATTTKSKAVKTKTPFHAPIAEVHLVPLDLIDVNEQIRKEFDDESIKELAKDIELRGLMQPVLLNPKGERFALIAGERRLRAVKINGQSAIPALITKTTDDDAELMQLSENIHRQDLNIEEECQAIKKLYDQLGSLKAVAEKTRKSLPWCSKRYAMTQKGIHWNARKLIEDNITEDLELVKAFSDLCYKINYLHVGEWDDKIRKGEAGRNEIRTALKNAKAKEKQRTAASKEKSTTISHAKTKQQTPPPPPPWTIDDALNDIDSALNYCDDETAEQIYDSWTDQERNEFNTRLTKRYSEGNAKRVSDGTSVGILLIRNAIFNPFYETEIHSIETMAMIIGYAGNEMNVREMLQIFQEESES